MPLRFLFTKGIAMCKLAIVKEREKDARKPTMKNVLNDQKYHEILQNSKILHTQSKLRGEIFKLAKFCNRRDHLKIFKTEMTFLILIGRKLLPTFNLNYSKTAEN